MMRGGAALWLKSFCGGDGSHTEHTFCSLYASADALFLTAFSLDHAKICATYNKLNRYAFRLMEMHELQASRL